MGTSTPRKRLPRKQTSQSLATPSRKRNPQRCRRCPGQPLRSECAHGYRRTIPEAEPSPAGGTALAPPLVNAPAPIVAPAELQAGAFPFTYASLAQLHALAVAQGIQLPVQASSSSTLVSFGSLPQHMEPTSIPLDPALLSTPQEIASTPPAASSSLPEVPSPDLCLSTDDESDDERQSAPPSSPSPRKSRTYASNSNPVYGLIEGVGRGNTLFEMARVRPLKAVSVSRKSATRKFNRLARDIFTRAEDISNGTACWMYVAMHQPGSGHPFLHFASRRLRNEAAEELKKIHQEVGTTMTMLKRADRAQRLDHERERLVAERMASDAALRADKAELEVQRLRDELAARNEVLLSLAKGGADGAGSQACNE
ncbi:hypothetical protein H1R20_g8116, partial [Candolleomyces eurysporus]